MPSAFELDAVNMMNVTTSVCIGMIMLLAAPSFAAACPIAFRSIGPVRVKRVEIVRPVERRVTRQSWRLDQTWTSTAPELNQVLVARDGRTYVSATFASQDTLSIDAAAPADGGWSYGDDGDPATQACAIPGQGEWRPPVVLIREDARQVTIAAAAQRTVGDRTGCALGAGEDGAGWGCPTLTRTILKLHHPIGHRRLVFEQFA